MGEGFIYENSISEDTFGKRIKDLYKYSIPGMTGITAKTGMEFYAAYEATELAAQTGHLDPEIGTNLSLGILLVQALRNGKYLDLISYEFFDGMDEALEEESSGDAVSVSKMLGRKSMETQQKLEDISNILDQ